MCLIQYATGIGRPTELFPQNVWKTCRDLGCFSKNCQIQQVLGDKIYDIIYRVSIQIAPCEKFQIGIMNEFRIAQVNCEGVG